MKTEKDFSVGDFAVQIVDGNPVAVRLMAGGKMGGLSHDLFWGFFCWESEYSEKIGHYTDKVTPYEDLPCVESDYIDD
jgi:hypothetical protein